MKHYILLLLTLILAGCGTSKPVVQVVKHHSTDTIIDTRVYHDSVYITQERYREQDTVYITRTEYRYKTLTDSIYVARVDSIPVVREVEVVREVTKTPTYMKILAGVGAVIILLLIVGIILKFVK